MIDRQRLTNASRQIRTMEINLPHLRYAIAAADEGSFRRAAELLLVRQSTLSRCIRQLEHQIGASIFQRSSGGITATLPGRSFLHEARSILGQFDSLVTTTHQASRGEVGRLSIGFYTSLSAGNLRATLLDFRQRFPSVELKMIETLRSGAMTMLRSSTMDAAIVTGGSPRRDSGSLPLWNERALLALPEDHPLADKETIDWTDLRGETVLLSEYDQGHELEDLLMSKLSSPEDRPRIERHHVSRSIIKSLVSVVAGVSLVTESDIGANLPGLIYRDIRDGAGSSTIGYAAHWREDNDNPALANFLKLLGERYPRPTV